MIIKNIHFHVHIMILNDCNITCTHRGSLVRVKVWINCLLSLFSAVILDVFVKLSFLLVFFNFPEVGTVGRDVTTNLYQLYFCFFSLLRCCLPRFLCCILLYDKLYIWPCCVIYQWKMSHFSFLSPRSILLNVFLNNSLHTKP